MTATVVNLPLSWAEQLIANGGPEVPEYGSRRWAELPDDSRAKVAACVVAAERWRTQGRSADVLTLDPQPSRRRRIAEANRPRPGDFKGGAVDWDRQVPDAR